MALSVGMLGYRFMGQAHSNALARLPMFFDDIPDVERDVVIGRDEEALAAAADQLGFSRTSTDWRDVVDEVDIFLNLGPNNMHAEPSIAALESGAAVLCEKPLAATLESARDMRDAAADADGPAGCAFNYRFVPAVQYARKLIEDGELGEIRHVRGRYLQDWLVDPESPWTWRLDADVAGSGALGDLGAHSLDLSRFLVGDRVGNVESVSGQLQTFTEERPHPDGGTAEVTVDDAFTAQVQWASGAIGTFEAARTTLGHKNDHSIEIHGTDGSLKFGLERLNELEVLTGDSRGYETIMVTDDDDPFIDHWWPPGHIIGWEHTFVHEHATFLKALENGDTFNPSFEDGYQVQRLLAAIEQSDETGEWVDVPR